MMNKAKRMMGAACLFVAVSLAASAQDSLSFNFSLDGRDKQATRLQPTDIFTTERGYGYDFVQSAEGTHTSFVSVLVPDGNYKVTVTLGSKRQKASTTVRGESRRLYVENIATKKGEFVTYSFVVNKRNTQIYGPEGKAIDRVKIKEREKAKLNWDDKLTLEITGDAPACSSIRIEPAEASVPTVYLCGNSTVVDQDYEPWASWGQMIPRWFDERVSFANYAESGETASTFIGANRLKKILSLLKPGDYVFVEFGHNDQKQKNAGAGAWYNFSMYLKQFIDETRSRQATIVFCTPTQRRNFDDAGRIRETHGDYPDAMRAVAQREHVPVIELHDMTRTFFETLGVEGSKRSLVHYPANTYPGQTKELADNTHFNPYGAYEISKMVVEGIKQHRLPIADFLRPDYTTFDPAHPDAFESLHWTDSPFTEALKPDGN